MSIHVQWDRKNRIVLEFVGRWDWGELATAGLRARTVAQGADEAVDLIFDLTLCGLLATGALFTNEHDYPLPIPANCDVVMIVGGAQCASTTALLCRAYPEIRRRYHTAGSLQEAGMLLNGRARKRPLMRRLAVAGQFSR